MNPTGTVEDEGRTLVITRRLAVPIEEVWASITESERSAGWIGTWTGDPATGSVMFTMNAEAEPVPATRYDIHACEPPHRLTVSAIDDFGKWHLAVELAEVDGATVLDFRQRDLEPGTVADIGPGWEWYLDRLAAVVTDGTPPSLADFDTTYAPLGDAYRALLP